MDAEGDAEFVAWAAKSFHQLVLMQAARESRSLAAVERREASARQTRRYEAISELQVMLRRQMRAFIEGE